jgi:hypothetical protein
VAQLIDEVTKRQMKKYTAEAVSQEVAEPTEELPEHYRGKTPAELIKMHQEAESRIGQQGEEVGKLRSVVDDFILNQTKVNEQEEAEEIDFFADPDRAVEYKIANHPTIKQLEQLGTQMNKVRLFLRYSRDILTLKRLL